MTFNWVLSEVSGFKVINILLGLILFGMGTTLKIENFVMVFKRPKEIVLGLSAQYIIMPLLVFLQFRIQY